jgi:hypothetical protein
MLSKEIHPVVEADISMVVLSPRLDIPFSKRMELYRLTRREFIKGVVSTGASVYVSGLVGVK